MIDKKRVIKLVHKMVGLNLDCESKRSRSCLLYAAHTIDVLSTFGVRAIVQSGDVQWPIVDEDQDDGIMNTHFAYMWQPLGDRYKQVLRDTITTQKLPEFHAWVAIPATQEIVDLTTRFQMKQATRAGLTWLGAPPPDHIWSRIDQLPPRTVYHPNMEACMFASALLRS